ncbi:MAG: MTH1187 family thiamine-binding protein [Nitrospirota bacterium]|jgi:uncharacterized protein (TIGR00106 family)
MLAELSIVPMGSGSSAGKEISDVLDIIDRSGLPYKLTPMGTIIEGDWDAVMALVKKCHQAVMSRQDRAITTIHIDDRKGHTDMIATKVASIEKRLGRAVRK